MSVDENGFVRPRAAVFQLSFEDIYFVLLGLDGNTLWWLKGLPRDVRFSAARIADDLGVIAFRVEGDGLGPEHDRRPGQPLVRLDVRYGRIGNPFSAPLDKPDSLTPLQLHEARELANVATGKGGDMLRSLLGEIARLHRRVRYLESLRLDAGASITAAPPG